MSQTKISAAQAAQVYAEVPGVLRQLVAERHDLRTKLASVTRQLNDYRQRDRIEKIARVMDEKGIDPTTSMTEKVAKIQKAAGAGKNLDVIEEAVAMTAPQQGLGGLGVDEQVGNGASQLESYLLGGLDQ